MFFIQQTISNACGTIGLLHALCNQASELGISSGFVTDMIRKTAGQTPSERASFLEESEDLEVIHTKHSQSGQTQVCFQMRASLGKGVLNVTV